MTQQHQEGDVDGRTRNRLATRERLLQAAIKVIMVQGYDAATITEIAAEAGVARRTAFNHFAAKGDIAVEWAVRRGLHAFTLVQHDRDHTRSVMDRVRAYFHTLAVITVRDWDETREMMTGWSQGSASPNHRTWLSGELSAWLDEWMRNHQGDRGPNGSVDATLAAELLFDVFQGVLLRWMRGRTRPTLRRFSAEVDTVVGIVLSGLAQELGQ